MAPCCFARFFQLVEVAGCRWSLVVLLQDAFSSLKLQDAGGSLLLFAGCFQLLELSGCRWLLVVLQDIFSSVNLQDAIGSLLLFARCFQLLLVYRMLLASCCFAGCFQPLVVLGCSWLLLVLLQDTFRSLYL